MARRTLQLPFRLPPDLGADRDRAWRERPRPLPDESAERGENLGVRDRQAPARALSGHHAYPRRKRVLDGPPTRLLVTARRGENGISVHALRCGVGESGRADGAPGSLGWSR